MSAQDPKSESAAKIAEPTTNLADNYRPLGLKAVLAASLMTAKTKAKGKSLSAQG